jgi:hypothetical protein
LWVYRCPVCGFRAEWPRIQEHAMDAHPEHAGRGGARPGAGRPRLGDARLIRRSVTLDAKHWQWLDAQGNASAALRELVERAIAATVSQ